jgi:hypothetical protein
MLTTPRPEGRSLQLRVKSNRARVKEFKNDLLSLMINTRLPAAIAVPRYRVNKSTSQIDENGIVVEPYTLSSVPGKVWIEHVDEKSLKAGIENELKPLTLLRENAENYLQEKREKEEGKNSD